MNLLSIIIIISIIAAAVVYVYLHQRRMDSPFIQAPNPLPTHSKIDEAWLDAPFGADRRTWRLQYPGLEQNGQFDYRCTAFTLKALLGSNLFGQRPTDIDTLYADIDKNDTQQNFGNGANPVGIVKTLKQYNAIKSYFNFDNISQLAEYVLNYAPVIASVGIPTLPAINDQSIFYAANGEKAGNHNILIYSVFMDERLFKVRWHLTFREDYSIDGLITFDCMEKILLQDRKGKWSSTYGYLKD